MTKFLYCVILLSEGRTLSETKNLKAIKIMKELFEMLKKQYVAMLIELENIHNKKIDNLTATNVLKENYQDSINTICEDTRKANEAFLCNGQPNAMLRTVLSTSIQFEALKLAKKALNIE